MTYFRIVCFALIALYVYVVGVPVDAATTKTEDKVNIRENGIDYEVMVQGVWIAYDNDDDCGNSAHRTANGGKLFAHSHTFYSFPVYGYVVGTGQIKNVTADNVKAYWDNYYDGLYGGTPDPKYNCWSYAFGQNVPGGYSDIWIEDPDYIYAYDYTTTKTPSTRDVIRKSRHAILVYETDYHDPRYPDGFVLGTYEKNRHSGLYLKVYYLWATSPPYPVYPYNNTIFYRRK